MTAPRTAEQREVDRAEARAELRAERLAGPPVEVPAEVREQVLARWPQLDLADPSTWPEPDRCTEGRPWGPGAYSDGERSPHSWSLYLRGLGRVCRNRAKHDDHLCGTHHRTRAARLLDDEKRDRREARRLRSVELARELCRLGVEATGTGPVTLTHEAAEQLIARLSTTPTPDNREA